MLNVRTRLPWLSLLIPIALYGSTVWQRPQPTKITQKPLFQGITYSRHASDRPRPHIFHIVDIDLTSPGLRPFVTPAYIGIDLKKSGLAKSHKARARRTSDFLQTHGLQLAVNANFFLASRDFTLWHYKPRSGDQVNLVGLSMSDGDVVAALNPYNKPAPIALCFMAQQAAINPSGTCKEGTQQAVAGNLLLLENGHMTEPLKSQISQEGEKPYSFTVAALDSTGTRLWLVLVDGKQPLYSEGMTLEEVAELVQTLGADTALRLDGGGSTTLAVSSSKGPTVLNSPIHAKVPGQERPVGNHLGFFAQPVAP